MKKPIIGITPQIDAIDAGYAASANYMNAIINAGGIPVILPLAKSESDIVQITQMCDGLLLAGGPDFDPALFGEDKLPECGEICPDRDEFELRLISSWLGSGKPILAICRGIQALNIARRGTLYQDIPTQICSEICHRMTEVSNKTIHAVDISLDTPLFSIYGKKKKVMVNSYHHQSVKSLGEGFAVMARAEDGVIEAMYLPYHKFCLALQWHPERLEDADTAKLFKAFIKACE